MQVKKITGVEVVRCGQMHKGDMHLTDHHIILTLPNNPSEGATLPSNAPKFREHYIAYPTIAKCIFRPAPPSSGRPSAIRLRCRDFVFMSFHFSNEAFAREAFEYIRARTCRLGSLEKLYAFSYQPVKSERSLNGWDLYDPKAEFRRQGISAKSVDRGWRISTINKDYSFSATYPAVLVVPSRISDNTLKYAGPYRSRARIPVLTYLHSLNNCSITRSSQPCVGVIGNKRSKQDEALVSASFSANATVEFNGLDTPVTESMEPSPSSSQVDLQREGGVLDVDTLETSLFEDELIIKGDGMYDAQTGKRLIYGAQQSNLIVDARPTLNAVVNQASGKGSENMNNYKCAKKAYLHIDNIHVMRDSLNTIIEALKDSDVSSLQPNRELLIKSGWLRHIKGILDGSALIARQVGVYHAHVLIHCSDGWDRTSQLSALSQIMLDPYFRTLEGFMVLVEKDWLSFGHMFAQRSGPLNHDNWFVTEGDTLASTTIQPGESEGRVGEAVENAWGGLKRFVNRNRGTDSTDTSDDHGNSDDVPKDTKADAKANEGAATKPSEISPVFHQFLDATYQLLRQHPTRFEFNERFLRRLLYHLYAGQYGTFLWNSEKARLDARAHERTRSVWDYFLSRRKEFVNPEYDATIDDRQSGRERVLFPKLSEIRWWASLFGRNDSDMNAYLDEAAARSERIGAVVNSDNSPGSRSRSPMSGNDAPTMPTSQSVLMGVETAHERLTLDMPKSPASLQTSTSADSGTFARLRDGVAGLDLGRGLFGGSANANSNGNRARNSHGKVGEQEMSNLDGSAEVVEPLDS